MGVNGRQFGKKIDNQRFYRLLNCLPYSSQKAKQTLKTEI